jgi:hypothetical protein
MCDVLSQDLACAYPAFIPDTAGVTPRESAVVGRRDGTTSQNTQTAASIRRLLRSVRCRDAQRGLPSSAAQCAVRPPRTPTIQGARSCASEGGLCASSSWRCAQGFLRVVRSAIGARPSPQPLGEAMPRGERRFNGFAAEGKAVHQSCTTNTHFKKPS